MDQKIITKHKIKTTSMKTQEQIKQDIVSYLTKTSAHTFIKPKATTKWIKEGVYYEYDYNDFTYFKIVVKDGEFYYLEKRDGNDYKLYPINIDSSITYYGNNAKCVISHNLFLGKKMKSVRSNKYHLGEVEKILESIK
jgi:hypothetical protein